MNKELTHVTSRSAARRAARVIAAADLSITLEDAASDARYAGKDEDAARAKCARSIAAQPGSASEAWLNAGASKSLGLAARWEQVFLAEYDRVTTALAAAEVR